MTPPPSSRIHGFSLVELSIVLVILGLLVGGVLAGQSLIRASELRTVGTQLDRSRVAVNAFRDKYHAIAGDMGNATQFWGIAAGSTGYDATCYAAATTDTTTCNGNGDRAIYYGPGGSGGGLREFFNFYKHLSNAGLIEGNYSGSYTSTGAYDQLPGTNIPALKARNGGMGLTHLLSGASPAFSSTPANVNWFVLGGYTSNSAPTGQIFTPEEVWNIDTKLDDGRPAYGWIITNSSTGLPNCVTGTDPATTTYKLDQPAAACWFRARVN